MGRGEAPNIAHCEDIEYFCLGCTPSSTHGPSVRGRVSIGPVGRAAIAGLAALGLLLHVVGLTALTWTPLHGKIKFSLQV